MGSTGFTSLSLNSHLLRAISEQGYLTPTPIQQQAIPEVLAGNDLLATAQTGTGKTAAFSLPMLHLLHGRDSGSGRHIRALILTPTRELAQQIETSFRDYGRYLPLRTAVVLGGVPASSQIKALKRNPDILIVISGRLLDLCNQGYILLDRIEILVLDEADRMLDMGFIRDVRKIVSALPGNRQTLFFSATLSHEIYQLASDMLHDPSYVAVNPSAPVADNIEQKVLFVEHGQKSVLLADLLKKGNIRRALVFARTKHRADHLKRQLSSNGISVEAIHSNKTQGARQRALSDFERGKVNVLVGTDIVSRGIDVEGISHVINFELPDDPANYVHRIGRTARAGAAGIALSFCDAGEVTLLRGIEKLTRFRITAFEDHPFHSSAIAAMRGRSPQSSTVSAVSSPESPHWGGRRRNKPRSRGGRRSLR